MSDWPGGTYRCIVADPPWEHEMTGKFTKDSRVGHGRTGVYALPYVSMPLADICALPVARLAESGAHLWLWTTNRMLRPAFDVLEAWGFTYLTTLTWVKPSGFGAWWASTTQHCLFGYFGRCEFKRDRYLPTHFFATPKRHSEKPDEFYSLVRRVSEPPAIDLFSRRVLPGFETWGNQAPKGKQLDLFAEPPP